MEDNKPFGKYFVQELITFIFKNWFSIVSIAFALSLLFIVINIFASNVLSAKRYLKASVFIDQNIIQTSVNNTINENINNKFDDETKNILEKPTLNFMNLLNEDLIKKSLITFYNNYSVEQVYPFIEFTPGEENLNKVYNALMGDEIFKYIKILSLDQGNLAQISKDVVTLSKDYFTIIFNLTDSNISDDDAKMIISGIVSELNNGAKDSTNSTLTLKVNKLDNNLKILEDDVSVLKKIFFLNKKIKQVDQNIEMFKSNYSNLINNIELNDADLNMDLVKYEFANIVVNFPKAIDMLTGNDEIEINKYKEKILTIDGILNDLSTENRSNQLNSEMNKSSEIVIDGNLLNELLSMESEIKLTTYRTKLYNEKIRLENALSDFQNFLYFPSNMIDELYKTEERIVDFSEDLRELILINNEFYDLIENAITNINLFTFSNKMSIIENNTFISKTLIKNTIIFLMITLTLNIFIACGYFSIYKSD